MIPLPAISSTELAGTVRRRFEYGRSNGTDEHPWTLKVDDSIGRPADKEVARVSAVAKQGELEIWTLVLMAAAAAGRTLAISITPKERS